MKKIFIIVVVILLIVFFVINNRKTEKSKHNPSNTELTYVIYQCNNKPDAPIPNDVETIVENNQLKLIHTLNSYCNTNDKNLSLSLIQNGFDLEILETFSATNVTRCTCPTKVEASTSELKPGTYTLKLTFDNRYTNEKNEIGTYNFEIK